MFEVTRPRLQRITKSYALVGHGSDTNILQRGTDTRLITIETRKKRLQQRYANVIILYEIFIG